MGKLWTRKRKKQEHDEKKEKKRVENKDRRDGGDNGYKLLVQSNELMELYYAYQGLHDLRCIDKGLDYEYTSNETDEEKEAERKLYLTTIRRILPSAFRISEDTEKTFLNVFLKELHEHLNVSTTEILPSSYFEELPYIPHGYQLAIDKRTIRKHKELNDFHEWLKQQTLSGIMTRQETVSMIPVQLLDIQPDHSVMDMCAAPGSKTCQILEKLNQGKGFVLANDSDAKRAFMLIHQLRRMNSSRVVVTSCEAQKFPLPYSEEEGMFDRVLADVPCSGDGTVRKNPGVWKSWSTLGAIALHTLQLNIALRGAALCKVGGYLVYSTCSLNPIENEAVVSEILRITNGSLQLVDARPRMKGLKARPGMQSWKVIFSTETNRQKKNKANKNKKKMLFTRAQFEKKNNENKTTPEQEKKEEPPLQFNRNIQTPTDDRYPPFSWTEDSPNSLPNRLKALGQHIYETYDQVPLEHKLKLRSSHFPPICEGIQSQLKHCIRVVPQDMDTGGFFVALFHKTDVVNSKISQNREIHLAESKAISAQLKELKNKDSKETNETIEAPADKESGEMEHKMMSNKNTKDTKEKETNFVVKPEQSILDDLQKYYTISPSFPFSQVYRRTDGDAKVLYYVHKSIQEQVFTHTRSIPIIHTGTKIFSRNNRLQDIPYRITQDGIHYVAPYMKDSDRYVVANNEEFLNCLYAGVNILVGDKKEMIEEKQDTTEKENESTKDIADKKEQNNQESTKEDDTPKKEQMNNQYTKSIVPPIEFTSEFILKIQELSFGSFVIALKDYEDDGNKKMFLSMWKCRGRTKINCLMNKIDVEDMKRKVVILGDL